MNDPFAGLQDNFISLYRKMVVPVFRYHLVRSGDWQEAQALTRETFLHAQAWFKPGRSDPSEINFWLFSIAVWVQLYKRRGVEIDDSILPTQEQVAQFVRVGEVTQVWNALPVRTADGLALFMFGGLELAEAGEVVNWDLPTIQEKLYVHLEDQVNLRLLTDELQPVGFFIGRLETELRENRMKTNRGAGPFFWRLAYRFNRAMGWSGRVLPLILFLVLLIWAIWYFSIPLQPMRNNQPTATIRSNVHQVDRMGLIPDSAPGSVFYSLLDVGQSPHLTEKLKHNPRWVLTNPKGIPTPCFYRRERYSTR